MFNRHIEHIDFGTLKVEEVEMTSIIFFVFEDAFFSSHHLTAHIIVDGIVRCLSQLEIVLPDDITAIRMGYIGAVMVDNEVKTAQLLFQRPETICRIIVILLTSCVADMNRVPFKTQPSHQSAAELVKRHVGSENGDRLSLLVVNRNHIGHQWRNSITGVHEGFRPITAVGLQSLREPRCIQVIVL